MVEVKHCPSCDSDKPLSEFSRNRRAKDGYAWYCKPCSTKANREHRQRNKDHHNAWQRMNHAREKRRVIEAYGGKCACCGESEPEFLTLDHVNGDGSVDRKSNGGTRGVRLRLIREGFPLGYQVLCFNCNLAKGKSGICPHQRAA